jgi:F-type H+-transporting ATPase subunit gamma
MASLKDVRNRIASVKSTQQITKAMKMVSAAKLRRAQTRILQMRPYALKLKDMLSNLSGSIEGSAAARYFEQRPVNKVLVVLITSDRGLAGSFNSAIVKDALRTIRNKYASQFKAGNVDIITVGKRGNDAMRRIKYKVMEEHNSFFHNITYEAAENIAISLMHRFTDGDYDKIEVVYNQFRNAAVFIPTTEQYLPIPPAAIGEGERPFEADYIFEPSKEAIVAQMINQSLRVNFFRMVLESNAAEHGARMTAMDKATENAEDLVRHLRLLYNKERQAAITKEILEIVGGAQALNG